LTEFAGRSSPTCAAALLMIRAAGRRFCAPEWLKNYQERLRPAGGHVRCSTKSSFTDAGLRPQAPTLNAHVDIGLQLRQALQRLQNSMRSVGHRYADISDRHPYITACFTAGTLLMFSDSTCQAVIQPLMSEDPQPWDRQRTLALGAWGAFWYGGPVKFLYLGYDRVFGVGQALKVVTKKVMVDVCLHTPLALIPSFYIITGLLRGDSLEASINHLKSCWLTASFGCLFFWLPVCSLNFAFVPQHSRILVVNVGNFLNKSFLSYLTKRQEDSTANET